MARTTYARKLSDDPSEVSATLAVGISLDHIVAMSMPVFAGMLWTMNQDFGYIFVFAAGGLISFVNMYLSSRIRIPATADAKSE
jgi:hypothetical protein